MQEEGRRNFLKFAGTGLLGSALALEPSLQAHAESTKTALSAPNAGFFNVRNFGATGDGKTLDTVAINNAIQAAEKAGGGTVVLPAGEYLCYSIRLKSNVALYLMQGATIIAADPLPEGQEGGYDDPEPIQPWESYQDYGHNHWKNSLIWGIGLENISILGPGRIWGRGLARNNGPGSYDPRERRTQGIGNKSISLKNCHNVNLKDFQILQGGWFGILVTGVDNLTIDNLVIDTNRDGMDIDCCRNVRITNCTVNSPLDDAIVPKSSFALGYNRPTENLTISNCYVTGAYEFGSVLNGTWKKWQPGAKVYRTGRIKFGTESNGGFKNITITNCVFDGCYGLALESEDGAVMEDVSITNITMRDLVSAPIFIRLGSRLRGPKGTHTGVMRRIKISNIVCSNAEPRFGSIISGVPDGIVEDVSLSNIYIQHRGGGTKEQAAILPPEKADGYPDPHMFGLIPAQGFFLRHVKGIQCHNIEIAAMNPDERPAFVLMDAEDVEFAGIRAKMQPGVPEYALHQVKDISIERKRGEKDVYVSEAEQKMV